MIRHSTGAVWGVKDMIPQTNFPDIRKKITIRSKAGNIIIIPAKGRTTPDSVLHRVGIQNQHEKRDIARLTAPAAEDLSTLSC